MVAGAEVVEADAVVLATPAGAAARLLDGLAPAAAAELRGVEYASMALVTMAFRRSELPEAVSGGGSSGFLVPPVDGRTIKASTFSSNKWAWAGTDPDLFLLRTSVGRYADEADLRREDHELVDVSSPTSARPWASRPGRSPPRSPAGTADCPSTRSATSTGSPGSARPWQPCRASRSAARSTTEWASRPVSRVPARPRTR